MNVVALLALVVLAGCASSASAPTDAARLDVTDATSDLPPGAACDRGCGAGAWCERGRCVCSSPQVHCGAVGCVDITVDPARCGSCTTRCPTGASCRDGRCNAPCPMGAHRCEGGCAANDDPTRCGDGCVRCAAPAHATATCAFGGCSFVCASGWHACAGGCAADDDVTRCGARCEACPAPGPGVARCVDGACVPRCEAGAHACGGRCVPDDAASSCGGRCEPCAGTEHGAATCTAGACDIVCDEGFRRCGDICSDGTSPLGCGAACARCEAPDGAVALCVAGACDFRCGSGTHRCGDRCPADVSPDACGARCDPCPAPAHGVATCVAGRCDFDCSVGFVRVGGACASVPRPLAPGSTARLAGRRPVFRWALPPDVSEVELTLCRDRACRTGIETHRVMGDRYEPAEALAPGVWFWRVGVPSSERTSATWMVRIGRRDTIRTTLTGVTMDVDADGYNDLAVGVPLAFAGQRVFVYRGSATGLRETIATTLDTRERETDFGWVVASVGDLDGDGFSDLAVSAPRDALLAGRVFLYRGSARGLSEVPSRVITGEDGTEAHWGASLAGLGDLDGDGYSDLAIGAYSAAGGVGRVHVRYGGPALLDDARTTVLDGTAPAGRFGFALALLGDLDGDGFAELGVGADGVGGFGGRVYVFRGGADGVGRTPWATLSVPGGSRFGAALAGVGDTDGDGVSEVLVGSLGEAVGAGRAYLFSRVVPGEGVTPTAVLSGLDGERAAFGMTVTGAGDMDGDGFDDVVVGAPQALDFTGRAYLFRGGGGGLERTPTVLRGPNESGAYFAGTLGAGRDFDGDGVDELAVSAERAAGYAGRVELISLVGAVVRTRVLFGPDTMSGRFGVVLAMR